MINRIKGIQMLKKLLRSPYPYVLLISYYGVWVIWDYIKLPYHDKAGAISYVTKIGYNPNNNLLRFLLAILLPPIACLVLWIHLNVNLRKKISHFKTYHRAFAVIVISISVLLCSALGIVQNSTNESSNPPNPFGTPGSHALVDTFHEGETLGPAISYEHKELKPYRDFVIVHGVFQDPLRTDIAFKLFGHSIGASRAFNVILGMLAFGFYFLLLLVLFKGNLAKSTMGLWILALLTVPTAGLPFIGSYIFGVQLPFRDIATMLFLMAAIVSLRATKTWQPKKIMGMSVAIGFIVTVGFANSIDRAIFIGALSLVWLALVYFASPKQKFFKPVFLPYILGMVLAIPILGLALKWAFADFASYLLTISKYKEFLDGMIFTQPNMAITILLLGSSILVTIGGAFIFNLLRKNIKRGDGARANWQRIRTKLAPTIQQHGIAILLAVTGLVFLRSAVGRALPDHFTYSVQWLYLFVAYIGINYLFTGSAARRQVLRLSSYIVLGFIFILFGCLVKKIDLRMDTFPIHVKDEKFMRTDYIDTANYLKKNLHGNESFATFTSEGAWYYFADKPSPLQYPIIWYAFTADQRHAIATQLAAKSNIKYIITNNNWTSDFDYVPNEVRFPDVYQVFHKYYTPLTGFGQQTVWVRN
jgi:hypothetical protein